ncbi:MarR family transcriptional regulator [Nakamurella sp. YIM 132087]|uniref:MarR family transcriptional regulator n=1 Tax=Nakamurella alba TaxID=2665158 RepID=A0A7K1FRI3_9ACTN|nr:hypothetical protein [Nakamurella alba]MTD16752.1 MarR family transcriptional regulator [Nakamurella alba]
MAHPRAKMRRMFELVEPIAAVSFGDAVLGAFLEHGMRTIWDGYFAGRAAALGRVPAEVVHAAFYSFAEGEAARHIPWVWSKVTPDEAIRIRERSSAAALRHRFGALADPPGLDRTIALATRAAFSAPTEGRVLYAALRSLDLPADPVARLWHVTTLLREYRGDGHSIALAANGIAGTEAHVLFAISLGMRPAEFGRLHHLPAARLDAVLGGLRQRGLIDGNSFTAAGRALHGRIEALTDDLAAPAYEVLSPGELDELIAGLEPLTASFPADTST